MIGIFRLLTVNDFDFYVVRGEVALKVFEAEPRKPILESYYDGSYLSFLNYIKNSVQGLSVLVESACRVL
ncbi:MAG: hypothetical protein QXG19_05305 [Candidatus Jordarchaeales archaeon]